MRCSECQHVQMMLLPWEWPASPWQWFHIDLAGPFNGHNIHSGQNYSAWPLQPLHTPLMCWWGLFARTGVPEPLVSEYGPQFMSDEFQDGIKHVTSAPYPPAPQGLVERFVQKPEECTMSYEGWTHHTEPKAEQLCLSDLPPTRHDYAVPWMPSMFKAGSTETEPEEERTRQTDEAMYSPRITDYASAYLQRSAKKELNHSPTQWRLCQT